MSNERSTVQPGTPGDREAPTTALLVTADDEVSRAAADAVTRDGLVRAVRRARSLASARSVLPDAAVLAVLVDPRVEDARVDEVGAWVRSLDRPVLVLVPGDDPAACLPALGPEVAHHVLTPGAPWQLLATAVRRVVEQRGEDHAVAGSHADWRDRLAVVRHEMATPLGAIEGFLATLIRYGDQLPAARRRDSLEAAHRNVGRLRRLVAELSAVTKAPAAGGVTDLSMVELGPRLERLVADRGPRGDEVAVDVPEGLHGLVDTDHLEAIVDNLIDNALKYGQPPIEVRARAQAGWVQIAVIDHGEGVPEPFVPRMFERYTRAEEVRDRERGSGIGLSLCAELAAAMGGRLRYERGQHGGAVFVLEVSARREAGRGDAPRREDEASTEPAGSDVLIDVAAVESETGERAVRQRPVAGDLQVVRDGLRTHTTVGLGYEGREVEGHAQGSSSLESSSRAVVRATLDAVQSFLGGAATFDVERIRVAGVGDDQHVTVTVTCVTDDGYERLVGAALIRTDLPRAAMLATLDALNRRIERLLV